jgi:drug/metabolite transporter (DMT)-like permease
MLRTSTAYGVYGVSLCGYVVSQLVLRSRLEKLEVGDALAHSVAAGAGLVIRDLACWGAGLLLVVGSLCWYVAMTKLPIQFMVPMAAIVTPAVALGSVLFLGQQLSIEKMMAIGLITIGVAWLGSMGA